MTQITHTETAHTCDNESCQRMAANLEMLRKAHAILINMHMALQDQSDTYNRHCAILQTHLWGFHQCQVDLGPDAPILQTCQGVPAIDLDL